MPVRPARPHQPGPPDRAPRIFLRQLATVARGTAPHVAGPAHHPPPPEIPSEHRLLLASYNLHKCVGTDGRFDPGRIATVIGELGADVVALQEADRRFGRRIGLLDPVHLHRLSGMSLLPVSELSDGHGWHGNAVLVRGEYEVTRLRRIALPAGEPRGAVVVDLRLPAGRLRLVAAHLGLLRRSRERQASRLLEAVGDGDPMPTVLMGDLNEWRPGRRSSLRPLEPVFGPMPAGPPSFPSRLPIFALDRILGWPSGIIHQVTAHRSPLATVASDHLPLKAWVDLAAGGARAAAA